MNTRSRPTPRTMDEAFGVRSYREHFTEPAPRMQPAEWVIVILGIVAMLVIWSTS